MEATTRMRFVGPLRHGRRVVELPIPFVARSQKEGELEFTPECEVPNRWVDKLLEFGAGGFEVVNTNGKTKPEITAEAPVPARKPWARRGRPPKKEKVTHGGDDTHA
jgi:hypothetical protein